jgi:hypothetical protein
MAFVDTPMKFEVSLKHDDFGCSINEVDGKFVITWTDWVANEWTETYDNFSEAIARLALLAACCESKWMLGFQQNSEAQHVTATKEYFAANLL